MVSSTSHGGGDVRGYECVTSSGVAHQNFLSTILPSILCFSLLMPPPGFAQVLARILTDILASAKSNEADDKPRVPPPPATPLDFPFSKPRAQAPDDVDPELDLLKLFSNILRTGPSHKHLQALNIDVIDNLELEELVPPSYLPPSSWTQDPVKSQPTNAWKSKPTPNEILSNGGPLPGHETFYTRVRELLHENQDAYRAVRQQTARADKGPARILHFRRFWENLTLMSEYWDTSKDNYSKRQSSDPNATENKSPSAIDIDDLAAEARDPLPVPGEDEDDAKSEETYTGHRKDTGRNMPAKYREETVFSFVEPLAWCFRCRLEHARMQPRVKISGMILPLPHNGNIYRTPEDPKLARRGLLEGPLAAVYCRDQLIFRRPDDAEGDGKQEILDLLRETGIGIMQAQKRAREGLKEEALGEGQWWATKPRWGGGKGGDMGVNEEETVAVEEANPQNPLPPGKRPRRNMNKAAAWREVRPPATTWEKGITYSRIGCERDTDYDDVSLVFIVLALI